MVWAYVFIAQRLSSGGEENQPIRELRGCHMWRALPLCGRVVCAFVHEYLCFPVSPAYELSYSQAVCWGHTGNKRHHLRLADKGEAKTMAMRRQVPFGAG